jgi:phage terminase large subunit
MLETAFPAKLQLLFDPWRFKVAYGGRAAGRSWSFAKALLIRGTQFPQRVICCRELQKSIKESVHRLLSDKIEELGLGGFYEVQRDQIIGQNGSGFFFEGLKNNSQKIKSYEGIDVAWVEEAANVSAASWEYLIPTIRKPGSEIWISFNPEKETDYTYQRFVASPPPNSFVVKMTWRDNPWVPQTMLDEMEDMKKRDLDKYQNIWEGDPVRVLEGAVYAKELRLAYAEGRIREVPWDRDTPVNTFWDLGQRDFTAIWFAQRVGMEFRILDYYQARGEDIHHFLKVCQGKPYTYGTFYLPHDSGNKTLAFRRSIQAIVQETGFKTFRLKRNAIADGINAARLIFPNCWFDASRCAEGIKALENNRYEVRNGQFSTDPVHNEFSDGADAFRYLGLALGATPSKGLSGTVERLLQGQRGETFESVFGLSRPMGHEGQFDPLSWMR